MIAWEQCMWIYFWCLHRRMLQVKQPHGVLRVWMYDKLAVAVVQYVSAPGYSARAVVYIHARSTNHHSSYSYYCPFFFFSFSCSSLLQLLIWTVFARSNDGIVGWNPTQGMDFCLRLFCFLLSCVGSGLATGWSLVQVVLPTARD
jgi:hypothetical protein